MGKKVLFWGRFDPGYSRNRVYISLFRELGWDIGEEINPHIYARQQWDSWTFLPFYKNVEHDKIVLI